MSKTNCVNCGSAKDIDAIKCPFCGTTYLDFTALDFDSQAPVVCEFVMPWNTGKVMQVLAIPRLDGISFDDVSSHVDCGGFRFSTFSDSQMNIGVSFIPLMQKDGSLFTIREGVE